MVGCSPAGKCIRKICFCEFNARGLVNTELTFCNNMRFCILDSAITTKQAPATQQFQRSLEAYVFMDSSISCIV